MDFIINLDTSIFLFFNGMHCTFADHFMQLVSDRFVWVPMYVAIAAVLVHTLGWRRSLIVLLCAALAVAAADQLCATVIRPVVQRMRPANPAHELSLMVHIVDGYRGGMYGFPSCHAANTFALIGLMLPLIQDRRFTATLFVWALLNCYSRIHLGVHYPGDLIVGAILGFSLGLAIGQLCSRLIKQPVYAPVLDFCSVSFRYTDFVTLVAAGTTIIIAVAAATL